MHAGTGLLWHDLEELLAPVATHPKVSQANLNASLVSQATRDNI